MSTAIQITDAAIQQAADSQERRSPGWQDTALAFVESYAKTHPQFMAEDVRLASVGEVPVAPVARAWGAVMQRARKAGIITSVGFDTVKNMKAHCTPANVWKSLVFTAVAA